MTMVRLSNCRLCDVSNTSSSFSFFLYSEALIPSSDLILNQTILDTVLPVGIMQHPLNLSTTIYDSLFKFLDLAGDFYFIAILL
mmetsp:Transcript_44615/g.51360  ORF Transcript_44615/g.51360 Transcript_44615/m.51360 type:complete len:84 (+) Transcript_44615:129-380(+)